jgi:hypothetical protein
MGAPERDIAQAKDFIAPPGYQRRRPEATLLYRLVAEHCPRFLDRRASESRLPERFRHRSAAAVTWNRTHWSVPAHAGIWPRGIRAAMTGSAFAWTALPAASREMARRLGRAGRLRPGC